jgi:CheY-like chemotaxis protein
MIVHHRHGLSGADVKSHLRWRLDPIPPAAAKGLKQRDSVGKPCCARLHHLDDGLQIGLLRREQDQHIGVAGLHLLLRKIETDFGCLLRMGADDYVVKPFGVSELLARGEAAVRRQLKSSDKDPVVRAGPLSIDLVSRMSP